MYDPKLRKEAVQQVMQTIRDLKRTDPDLFDSVVAGFYFVSVYEDVQVLTEDGFYEPTSQLVGIQPIINFDFPEEGK